MRRNQNFWSLLRLLLLGVVLVACESSEDPVPNNNNNPPDNDPPSSDIEGCQYPTTEMLDVLVPTIDQGFFKTTNGNPNVYQVFGYSFEVAFDGVIKELGVKVPEAGTYTVRIYYEDPVDTEILAEADIQTGVDEWTFVDIDALEVNSGTLYMTAVYFKSKPEGLETAFNSISDFDYPQTFGDVTISSYAINSEVGAKPKPLAQTQASALFNGFVDFCFEAN